MRKLLFGNQSILIKQKFIIYFERIKRSVVLSRQFYVYLTDIINVINLRFDKIEDIVDNNSQIYKGLGRGICDDRK